MSNLSAVLLGAAAIGLGRAIHINNGFYDGAALAWLTCALFLSLAALVPGKRRSPAGALAKVGAAWDVSSLAPIVLLSAGLVWQYWTLLTARPAMYVRLRRPWDEPVFFGMLIAAALLTVGVIAGTKRSRLGAFVLVLAIHLALGGWIVHASPNPRIDVVTVHREALQTLKGGGSPYSITFANIYRDEAFYSPGVISGGRVQFGLPYPPLSLLMAAPGEWLAGDYRYASLAALTIGGALIGLSGWRRQSDANAQRQASLAALALLFTPRVFFQLEQGWTEPFMVLLLAGTVVAANTRASHPIAGLLLAVKQYLILTLPLMVLLWPRRAWRRMATAAGIAAVITAPFFVWDPDGFIKSVVLLQFAEPFRLDSLSYLSWTARHGFGQPGVWVTLVAAGVAMGLSIWRLPRTASGFSAGVALVMLASFAFGKKAFCNYYFFVIAALTTAVAAAHARSEEEEA